MGLERSSNIEASILASKKEDYGEESRQIIVDSISRRIFAVVTRGEIVLKESSPKASFLKKLASRITTKKIDNNEAKTELKKAIEEVNTWLAEEGLDQSHLTHIFGILWSEVKKNSYNLPKPNNLFEDENLSSYQKVVLKIVGQTKTLGTLKRFIINSFISRLKKKIDVYKLEDDDVKFIAIEIWNYLNSLNLER